MQGGVISAVQSQCFSVLRDICFFPPSLFLLDESVQAASKNCGMASAELTLAVLYELLQKQICHKSFKSGCFFGTESGQMC